jgi:hypothetical protein
MHHSFFLRISTLEQRTSDQTPLLQAQAGDSSRHFGKLKSCLPGLEWQRNILPSTAKIKIIGEN